MSNLTSGQLPSKEFCQRLAEILEELFPPRWFEVAAEKTRSHPAYSKWQVCKQAVTEGVRGDSIKEVGLLAVELLPFVVLTEGKEQELRLGLLDLMGDENVLRKIRSRITDPAAYADLVV